jgi:hypothetical protein
MNSFTHGAAWMEGGLQASFKNLAFDAARLRACAAPRPDAARLNPPITIVSPREAEDWRTGF